MAFDTEQFFKYGILPAAETLRDYMGYNWERKLALQKHLQTMAETQYQYNRREEEQQRGYEFDVNLRNMDVEFTKMKDEIDRNQIVFKAGSDIGVARKKAYIDVWTTAQEEGIRFDFKKKGYDVMVKSLRELRDKDPGKGDEISINSLNKAIESLDKLSTMRETSLQEIGRLESQKAKLEADKKTDHTADIKTIEDRQKIYKDNVNKANQYQNVLDAHVLNFKKIGVTQNGVIPEDKQVYLLEALEYLRKISPEDVSKLETGEIIGGVNAVLGQVMPGLEITKEDSEFILLHALSSIKKSLRE